jgi:hypothetical protein
MCYVHNQWYDISCATLHFCGTDLHFKQSIIYKHHVTSKVRADLHVSTSALNGCECLASRPGRFTAEDTVRYYRLVANFCPNREPNPSSTVPIRRFVRQLVIQSANVMGTVLKQLC